MDLYSDEPLLCRMASRVALQGPSLVYRGEPAKGVAPTSGVNDAMLAFSQAHRACPIGWTIFQVKYLEVQEVQKILVAHVMSGLPNTPHREQLAKLVCQGFCTGGVMSRRHLRRELDIDRVLAGQYYEEARRALYWLRVTEHQFAVEVRAGL